MRSQSLDITSSASANGAYFFRPRTRHNPNPSSQQSTCRRSDRRFYAPGFFAILASVGGALFGYYHLIKWLVNL